MLPLLPNMASVHIRVIWPRDPRDIARDSPCWGLKPNGPPIPHRMRGLPHPGYGLRRTETFNLHRSSLDARWLPERPRPPSRSQRPLRLSRRSKFRQRLRQYCLWRSPRKPWSKDHRLRAWSRLLSGREVRAPMRCAHVKRVVVHDMCCCQPLR